MRRDLVPQVARLGGRGGGLHLLVEQADLALEGVDLALIVDTSAATVGAIPGEPLVQSLSLTLPASAAHAFYRLAATPQ